MSGSVPCSRSEIRSSGRFLFIVPSRDDKYRAQPKGVYSLIGQSEYPKKVNTRACGVLGAAVGTLDGTSPTGKAFPREVMVELARKEWCLICIDRHVLGMMRA